MFLINLMFCFQAKAGSYDGDYAGRYSLKSYQDDQKIIHGYYPYYFSNSARSRYSYSEEEKGVYQRGAADKAWPFPLVIHKLETVVAYESAGVLYSGFSKEQQDTLEKRLALLREEAKVRKIIPQVNDSRDLEKIIEQHRWTWESPAIKEAYAKNSDHVRTDLTDYDELFQQK